MCLALVLALTACGTVKTIDKPTDQVGDIGKSKGDDGKNENKDDGHSKSEDPSSPGVKVEIPLPAGDFDDVISSVEWRQSGTLACEMGVSFTMADLFGAFMTDEEYTEGEVPELDIPIMTGEMKLYVHYNDTVAKVQGSVVEDSTGFIQMFGDLVEEEDVAEMEEEAIVEDSIEGWMQKAGDNTYDAWMYNTDEEAWEYSQYEGTFLFGWFDLSLLENMIANGNGTWTGSISYANFNVLQSQLYGEMGLTTDDFDDGSEGYYSVVLRMNGNMVESLDVDIEMGYLRCTFYDLQESDLTIPMEVMAR